MTPKILNYYLSAYTKREKEKSKEKITLAYINAMWTAQWFSKNKPKKLEEILKDKPKVSMTDEEMLKQVKMLNAMFGGEVK